MLPGWSGVLGQLLRSIAFFDGRGATHSVIVLVTWPALGVMLGLASGPRAPCRHRRSGTSEDAGITASTTSATPAEAQFLVLVAVAVLFPSWRWCCSST